MGKYKIIRVHEKFAENLEKQKKEIESESGIHLSMPEFTRMISDYNPIKVKKTKKKKNFTIGFDF